MASPWRYLLVYLALVSVCAGVYRDARPGPFVSDDLVVIETNPYVQAPFVAAGLAVFEPRSDARSYVGGNYAPLIHVAHAVQWRLFGRHTAFYHDFNVAVHALNATLLAALLGAVGVPFAAAVAGSAFFALHPANVEAVAWISQLRTLLAMACSLAGLLLLLRAPGASALPFAAGLLFKASAAAALPAAAALYWASRRRGDATAAMGRAVALWVLAFLAYAPLQLGEFSSFAAAAVDPYPDALTALRTISAIGARYLLMAATGYGVSAYHLPQAVGSSLDPWWIAGILLGLLLAGWTFRSLRRGEVQAAFWLLAAASFAPVSQVIPFAFPIADRYLYFILPGLLGGWLLALQPTWQRVEAWLASARSRSIARAAALAIAALWIARFGVAASARAGLWTSWESLYADSARSYPDGMAAHYLRARDAADRGDLDAAFRHLERYVESGGDLNQPLAKSPHFPMLEGNPRYQEVLRQASLHVVAALGDRTHPEYVVRVAEALVHLERFDEAVARLEAAVERGGPQRADLFTTLMMVRGKREAHARGDPVPRGAHERGREPIAPF